MDPVLLATIAAGIKLFTDLLEKGDKVTPDDVDVAQRKTQTVMSDYGARLATIRAARAEKADEAGAWDDGGGEHVAPKA